MDFFQGLGNFLSGKGWRDNRAIAQDEEKKKRQKQVQQQTTNTATPQARPTATIAMPGSQPGTAPQSNTVDITATSKKPPTIAQPNYLGSSLIDQVPNRPKNTQRIQKSEPRDFGQDVLNFGKEVGLGLLEAPERAIRAGGDIALQGGAVIGSLGKSDKEIIDIQRRTEEARKGLNAPKFLATGREASTKVDYTPTGDFGRDVAQATGKGLGASLDITGLLNPGKTVVSGIPQGIKRVGQEASLFGGSDALAGGAQTYGETGDVNKSIEEGAKRGLTTAVIQGTLGGAAEASTYGRNIIRKPSNEIDTGISSPSMDLRAQEAIREAELQAASRQRAIEETQAIEAQTIRKIEEQRARQEAEAQLATETPDIISTPFDQPVAQPIQSAPLGPNVIENQPELVNQAAPLELSPEQRAYQDAVEVVNQRQVEQPLAEPQAVGTEPPVQPIDTPTEAASRQIAEDTAPIDPEAVEAQRVAEEGPAPEEMGAVPEEPGVDPRIESLREEAKGHLARADEVLSGTGSSLEDLGTKLYVASVNKTKPDLTPAERDAFNYLNDNINDAESILVQSGILNKDLGVRSNYLPTGKASEIEANKITSPEQIDEESFTYGQERTGGFIDDKGNISDELPKGIRAAYEDYYVKGKGAAYLKPEKVDAIKTARKNQEDIESIYYDNDGKPLTDVAGNPVELPKETTKKIRENNVKTTELERKASNAQKKGDVDAYKTAHDELHQHYIDSTVDKLTALTKMINSQIEATKSSNLNYSQKAGRIAELEGRLSAAKAKTAYEQTYVKTNMLLQIPGRVADQIGKVAQATGDALTGWAGNIGARKSYGGTMKAKDAKARLAVDNVAKDKSLSDRATSYEINKKLGDATSNSLFGKVVNRYKALGTRVTEQGSRETRPRQDAANFFAAQAQGDGLTTTKEIESYIRSKIGTKEWDRVYGEYYTMRNRYSGVPALRRGDEGDIVGVPKKQSDEVFDNVKKTVAHAINQTLAPITSTGVRKNLIDGLSIPIVGFPRVVWNVGTKGVDYATFGAGNFWKASKIDVVDDASALHKALLLKQAVESAASGGALGTLGFMLGQQGMITGSEPEKQANGEYIPPYALKLGNDYVELGRFVGPYAVPVLMGATWGRGGNAAEIAGAVPLVASQVLENVGADSIGDTMVKFGEALQGDTSEIAGYLPNILAAFGPISGELNSISKGIDPYQRNTKDDNQLAEWANQIKAKIPLFSQTLPEKVDQFGNKIPSSPLKLVVPLQGTTSGFSDSELGTETSRLELKPSGSSNTQENAEEWGNRLIATDWYKGLDDTAKKEALNKALYSGEFKDINSDLDESSKLALGIGRLLPKDKKAKWLDDTTNARDYYVADYENEIKNDTLTADDDNLESMSSKHYKAVASQVNLAIQATPKLLTAYKDISKKEWAALSDDNPLKQQLWNLDQERAKNGVSRHSSDKSTPKYGVKSGSGGGKGRGGSGGGKGGSGGSFGQLVDIAGGSGSGKGSGLKYEGIDNNQFANKQVPQIAKAETPKKKTISVKRGIQL